MKQMHRGILGVGMMLVGLLCGPAWGADAALEAIPDDAGVVIRVKAPKATIDKVAAFVNMVQPGFGEQVKLQAQGIGLAILNPSMEGVDSTKDWYIAVFSPEEENGQPDTVFVIPATDVKKMAEGLGEDVKFMEHGSYGVYTQSERAAEFMKEHLSSKGESIAGEIDETCLKAMDRGEFAVYVNVASLIEEYSDELDELKNKGLEEIENMPAQEGVDTESVTALLKEIVEQAVTAARDVKAIVATASVSKQGVTLEQFATVKADSGASKFLAKSAPDALVGLGALPAGQLMFMGIKADLAPLFKLATTAISALPDAVEGKEKLVETMGDMAKLTYGPILSGISLGDLETGLFRGVTQMMVKPTDKARTLFKTTSELSGAMNQTPGIKMSIEYKEKAETIAGEEIDVATVSAEVDEENAEQGEMVKKMLDMFYGPEGLTSRYAYLKDRVVYTMGGTAEDMETALTNVKTPGKPSDGFAKARGKLSEKVNVIFMADLAKMIAQGASIASSAGLIPMKIDADLIDGLELKESYFGFSLATEPDAVRAVWHLPVEQVQGFAKMAIMAAAMQGAGN
jgi:hypothetical protein